jgi:hypothetical protein
VTPSVERAGLERPGPVVERLDPAGYDAALDDLAAVLHACVGEGASIGFVAPFTLAQARAYWSELRESVARSARVVLACRDGAGHVVGTVQVVPAPMPNGAHRADVAKLLVHPRARCSGLGQALMTAAEQHAGGLGRSLLVLDTATDGAERLYRRLGYRSAGVVPGYARSVDGTTLDATTIMFKHLSAPSP